jgi:signal transduction histidine kinase
MPLGNSIEVVLLSLALASKINELKRETAEARESQLQLAQRNEQMVKDQNQLLEARVHERTEQLQAANRDLNVTLENLRAAQEQLVQSEKLASIGQLTAGIAHELNNPINFVSSSSQSLRRDFEDVNEILAGLPAIQVSPEEMAFQLEQLRKRMAELDLDFTEQEIAELLTGIEDGAQRTAEIVRGLRIFSRMDGDAFIEADLNELMNSTLVILRSNMRDRVRLEVELAPELPHIRCQPGRLNQVFMNIINNAAQATQETTLLADDRLVRIRSWSERLPEGTSVLVGIADNGPGIPDHIKSQIFDPFFTTKPVGEGTGLGLSIVMGILKDHRAEVEVRTAPGSGTEFILRFPA